MPKPTPIKKAPAEDGLRDFSRSLPMVLLRAREAVMGRFRPMLREHDVTEQQWRVLRALSSAREPLRSSDLSRLTLLSLPSLSRLLKALEARGLIDRAAHTEDLRAAQISISRPGRSLVAKIAPQSEARYRTMSQAIGEDEVERLYRLLEKAIERLGEPEAGEEG